jgi:hypothetical protein
MYKNKEPNQILSNRKFQMNIKELKVVEITETFKAFMEINMISYSIYLL